MKKTNIIIFLLVFVAVSSCDQSTDIKTPDWYFIEISWGSYWNNEIKHARIISTKDSLTISTTAYQDSIISIQTYPIVKVLKDSIFMFSYASSRTFDLLDTSMISSVSDGGNNITVKIAANNMTVENSYAFSNVSNTNSNIKRLLRVIKTATGDTTIPN